MADLFVKRDADRDLQEFAELVGWVPNSPNELFQRQYEDTLKKENPIRPTKPGFIRPSSLTECLRKLVFEYTGAPEESFYDGTPRIAESGTDAHKRIQGYVAAMKQHGYDVEYMSIPDYLAEHPNPDLEIIDETAEHTIISTDIKADKIVYRDGEKEKTKALSWYMERYLGPETLVYNKRTKSRFKADGIVKFNGKYFVLEIKTENSKKYASHVKTLLPHDKHTLQGTFYGISFGIDDVMFLYENRDTCATFVTVFHITQAMKDKVERLIADTISYGDNEWIAPRTVSRMECMYCPYKSKCDAIGDTFPR